MEAMIVARGPSGWQLAAGGKDYLIPRGTRSEAALRAAWEAAGGPARVQIECFGVAVRVLPGRTRVR